MSVAANRQAIALGLPDCAIPALARAFRFAACALPSAIDAVLRNVPMLPPQ